MILTGQQHEQYPPAGPYQRDDRSNNGWFASVSLSSKGTSELRMRTEDGNIFGFADTL